MSHNIFYIHRIGTIIVNINKDPDKKCLHGVVVIYRETISFNIK